MPNNKIRSQAMKRLLVAMVFSVAAVGVTQGAIAGGGEFSLTPAASKEAVASYLGDRLYDPRSARVQLSGEAYRVIVDMRGGREVELWAIDVLVKSRLPSGSWSNYQPYTVIFQSGRAVALESDFSDVTPI
jgi:hypothetical protein